MLINSMVNGGMLKNKEQAIEILNKLGIDINIRGETLSIEQFCEISNLLAKSL